MSSAASQQPAKADAAKPSSQPLGQTWSNTGSLNIDIDNLSLIGQKTKGVSPSMNQLASTPTSPVNQPRAPVQSPTGMYGMPWQASPGQAPNQNFFPAFK